jgi:FtsP/CotA-like multicopper oxidase with cupredoxin domain
LEHIFFWVVVDAEPSFAMLFLAVVLAGVAAAAPRVHGEPSPSALSSSTRAEPHAEPRALAGVTNVIGAPLVEPLECTSLACTLTVDAVAYVGPAASFTTRGYNGGLPGPTIRAKAGDTLVVNLVNNLEAADNTAGTMNNYRTPNTTNLHTHGLHVSSVSPGDDAFLEVEPLHSFQYTYQIPANHMGGTFWYHPHHHGSTALQAGGGMAGMLIIDDAVNEIPPEISAMKDVVLMFMHVPMSTVKAIQTQFNTWMWNIVGTTADVLLTNGQSAPTLAVVPGRWYRFRMAYAAVEAKATMSFIGSTGTAVCELQLLAKDGIYLPVTCPCFFVPCLFSNVSWR